MSLNHRKTFLPSAILAFSISAAGLMAIPTATQAKIEQCVYKGVSPYNAVVHWYPPGSLTIDNSEPWKNRLMFRRTTDGDKGDHGIDMVTGKVVHRGVHIKHEKRTTLRAIGAKKSCITSTSGKYVAFVNCIGCSEGSTFLNNLGDWAIGAALNIITPGLDYGFVLDQAYAMANTNVTPLSLIRNGLNNSGDSILLETEVNSYAITNNVRIHDVSDLPHLHNLIYVGTPRQLNLIGNIFNPGAREADWKEPARNSRRYRVYLDCYHNQLESKWTATVNSITVELFRGDQPLVRKITNGSDINCNASKTTIALPTLADPKTGKPLPFPDRLRISTSGSDGFFVDRIEMRFTQIQGQGRFSSDVLAKYNFRNNGSNDNFCLSTDETDGSRRWGNFIYSRACVEKYNISLK